MTAIDSAVRHFPDLADHALFRASVTPQMAKTPSHDRLGVFALVPPAGFEPATPALGERCSIP